MVCQRRRQNLHWPSRSEQILPDRFPNLKGALVEVAATVSHEVTGSDRGKSDNFYTDLFYIAILEPAPPSPLSPLKKKGPVRSSASPREEATVRMTLRRHGMSNLSLSPAALRDNTDSACHHEDNKSADSEHSM